MLQCIDTGVWNSTTSSGKRKSRSPATALPRSSCESWITTSTVAPGIPAPPTTASSGTVVPYAGAANNVTHIHPHTRQNRSLADTPNLFHLSVIITRDPPHRPTRRPIATSSRDRTTLPRVPSDHGSQTTDFTDHRDTQ